MSTNGRTGDWFSSFLGWGAAPPPIRAAAWSPRGSMSRSSPALQSSLSQDLCPWLPLARPSASVGSPSGGVPRTEGGLLPAMGPWGFRRVGALEGSWEPAQLPQKVVPQPRGPFRFLVGTVLGFLNGRLRGLACGQQGTSVDVRQLAEIPVQVPQVGWVSVFLSRDVLVGSLRGSP